MAERFEPVTGFDLEEQVKYAKFADELLKANISTDLYTVRQALGAKAKEEPDLKDRYLCIMTKLGFEKAELLDMNTREVFHIDKKNLLKSLGSGVSTNTLPVTK